VRRTYSTRFEFISRDRLRAALVPSERQACPLSAMADPSGSRVQRHSFPSLRRPGHSMPPCRLPGGASLRLLPARTRLAPSMSTPRAPRHRRVGSYSAPPPSPVGRGRASGKRLDGGRGSSAEAGRGIGGNVSCALVRCGRKETAHPWRPRWPASDEVVERQSAHRRFLHKHRFVRRTLTRLSRLRSSASRIA
jgi:hypothetical protein